MKDYLNILQNNYGFKEPAKWLEVAKKSNYSSISYKSIEECPYCATREFTEIGAYVYYSTYQTVRECPNCNLCYVDVLIDQDVRIQHFENAYKLESYFEYERKDIFKCILKIIRHNKSDAKKIFEMGGATGILLSQIKSSFQSATCLMNDVSHEACDSAKRKGLETIQGEISSIVLKEKQDIVLAIDVLYYELDIKKSLEVLSECVNESGLLILRLPNKYFLIKFLWQFYGKNKFPPRLKYFNPEHLLMLTKPFLKLSLRDHGFSEVQITPSPVLRSKKYSLISSLIYYVSIIIYKLTGLVISPSMFVVAKK